MSATELEQYRAQLAQVEAVLSADPTNEELRDLAKSLEEVIALQAHMMAQSAGVSGAREANGTDETGAVATSASISSSSGGGGSSSQALTNKQASSVETGGEKEGGGEEEEGGGSPPPWRP